MNHYWQAIGWTLVHFLWQGAGIALVYWVVDRALARRSANARYVLALAALLGMLAVSLSTLAYEEASLQPSAVRADSAALVVRTSALTAPVRAAAASARPAPAVQLFVVDQVLPFLDVLWLAGVLFLTCRALGGWWLLRRLRLSPLHPAPHTLLRRLDGMRLQMGIRRFVDLRLSSRIADPLTAGVLRPWILLPIAALTRLSPEQVEVILSHELAHIRRRDCLWNILQTAVETLFFFHPAVWWISRRAREERELCCDDAALAHCPDPSVYASALLSLEENRRNHLRLAMALDGHQSRASLRARILRILGDPDPSPRSVRPLSLAGVAVSVAIFFCPMPKVFASFRVVPKAAASITHAVASAAHATIHVPIAAPAQPAPANAATPSPAYPAQSSGTPSATSADQDKTWRHEWKLTRHDSSSSSVQLTLISRSDDGNDREDNQDVPLSSLAGFSLSMLDRDGPVKFEYVRDAGRIVCEGRVSGGRASGPFTVVLDPSFVASLEKMGYAAPDDDEAFSLVTSDVTLGYAQAVRDTGLTSSVSDLVHLRDHGVSSDYVRAVRQEGFTNLTASDISDLRDHGVDPSYLKAIKAADPSLSINAIDSLYDHGVKPDYYQSMKASAPQLSIGQVDSLYDHGVEPNTYTGFASVDPKLSIDEINSLRDHGVKPEYYRGMKSVNPNMSIGQIDSLYDHGVKPDAYKGFASVDPKLSSEELDSLRDHGVEPDTYKGFTAVDPRLSIEQIDSLRDHGVAPEFYQGTKAVDSAVSIEDIDTLRDHGVEPEYLREIRALPDGFSISDIAELRDHGITAKYIRNLHDLGMKNLTAAQIIRLRDGE
ncbi:MAG TPA: M56 family metallopeptidase [Acidobacteriaceae bacterium]|nr:M56 family metallopeptidase [Acidobacteriaceae bacterium]